MGHWIFEELRGGPRRTPQEAELFKDDQSDEGEYAGNDHLVREVLQNSLDARSESADGPVQVSLALHDASDAPAQERLTHFFARLKAPLAGKEIEFHRTAAPWLPCRFLVCEDFGTRGLEGDATLFWTQTRATARDKTSIGSGEILAAVPKRATTSAVGVSARPFSEP